MISLVQIVIASLLTPNVLAESQLGTSSSSLVIGGVVPRTVQLTVIPRAGNNQLNIIAGEQDVTVAVVNEKSNSPGGFTVTLTSQNATAGQGNTSILCGLRDRSNQIRYSLKYGPAGQESEIRLNQGRALVTHYEKKTGPEGITKVLKVTVPPVTVAQPDTYQDTLILTLTSK